MPHDHLAHVAIAPERLERWREVARTFGEGGITLALELAALADDPSRHNLRRAARAAWFAETTMTGDTRLVAQATAIELEAASEGEPT